MTILVYHCCLSLITILLHQSGNFAVMLRYPNVNALLCKMFVRSWKEKSFRSYIKIKLNLFIFFQLPSGAIRGIKQEIPNSSEKYRSWSVTCSGSQCRFVKHCEEDTSEGFWSYWNSWWCYWKTTGLKAKGIVLLVLILWLIILFYIG